MTIQLKKSPTDRVIELGGGANPLVRPNCDVRWATNAQGEQVVDFLADFNESLPITSDEWDSVFSRFVLEHLSWRKVRSFLREVYRILKPGGKTVLITANTEAQLRWITDKVWMRQDHEREMGEFDACSCILFGGQDYDENTHRNFLSPSLITSLLQEASFESILVRPYGDSQTDMIIEAMKPSDAAPAPAPTPSPLPGTVSAGGLWAPADPTPVRGELLVPREELYDWHYFNGGGKVGGYAAEGYRDFVVHEVTARHVLDRKPASVLELGTARGYVLRRVQDQGVPGTGLEISQHCWLTRACGGITRWDVCKAPWPIENKSVDLLYSVAFLEHIPQEHLDGVVQEMKRVSRRGLHGIDLGQKDDAFDKTHVSLYPREFWVDLFKRHDYPCEVLNKEDLEKGDFPQSVLKGDGKTKLNLGCGIACYHHGWVNVDTHDFPNFINVNGYSYLRHDLRQGIPLQTGSVDLIHASHLLECMTFEEGLRLLRECRRVLKPDGAVRLAVADAGLLASLYAEGTDSPYAAFDDVSSLEDLAQVSENCAKAGTSAEKLWALLSAGKFAAYDYATLSNSLRQAGFRPSLSRFRESIRPQFLLEALDHSPSYSLFVEALPVVG